METNYHRPIGENGKPRDNFAILDLPFILLFFLEFSVRTLKMARHYTGLTWLDAMLWRWYDIFLFLPVLRWLRIIPLAIRLNQARLIDLQKIQRQVSQGLVATIAEDVTQVVMVRVINQLQNSLRQGGIQSFLTKQNAPYLELNESHEMAEITKILLQITAHKVIPQTQADAEALLKYNIEKALNQRC